MAKRSSEVDFSENRCRSQLDRTTRGNTWWPRSNLRIGWATLPIALALLRVLPLLFPLIFVCAAVTGTIFLLYAAVGLHIIIIVAENTIGRRLYKIELGPLSERSTRFEDLCILIWPMLHLLALAAAMYLILQLHPSSRQVFAMASIFAYSINTFSATAGHELLHRTLPVSWACADVLYTTMLYPHFPTVHFASHHPWAGSSRDCQTPRPGQSIYPFLVQTLIGGMRIIAATPMALDLRARWRVAAAFFGGLAFFYFGGWKVFMFYVVQGLFAFILIETINYVQHYSPVASSSPNQDLNFISRSILFNLPLHASHHADEHTHCMQLKTLSGAPSYRCGYWTAFWLVWAPPLWTHLNSLSPGKGTGS
jgi:alkane 1-monooxygenase